MALIPVNKVVVPDTEFVSNINPKPQSAHIANARAIDGGDLMMEPGSVAVAGQRLNIKFSNYFPPLQDQREYDTAKLFATITYTDKSGEEITFNSKPTPVKGYWAYDGDVPVKIPEDAQGTMKFVIRRLRDNGEIQTFPAEFTTKIVGATSPIVKFSDEGDGWATALNGKALKGGDSFRIAYDIDRIMNRIQSEIRPDDRVRIDAMVSFDGKYPLVIPVYAAGPNGSRVDMPTIRIPEDAKQGRVWFSATVYDPTWRTRNIKAPDSDFGNDFQLPMG